MREGPTSWLTELCAEVHPNDVTAAATLTATSNQAFVHPRIATHRVHVDCQRWLSVDQLCDAYMSCEKLIIAHQSARLSASGPDPRCARG